MRPVRVAIVGAGWVTEHHLAAYRSLGDDVRVVAIADPDPAVLAERADRWGIPHRFASDAEMLASVEVDAVDVASPRQHHAASVRLAAGRGLAIFCQKPLAPSWAEARALVDGLPPGARLMVHENWRHRPHYGVMRDWIAEGRLGAIRQGLLLVRTCGLLPDAGGVLPALERQPMLARLDRMLLMEVMIHHVDTLRSLVGEMEILGAVSGSDTDALRGEDRFSLLFRAEGAAVSVVGDFRTHGAPPSLMDELGLQGTDAAIELSGPRLRLIAGGAVLDEREIDLAADYAASYRAAIARFVQAVRIADPGVFRAQTEDNLKTLDLVERAYRLAHSPAPPSRAG